MKILVIEGLDQQSSRILVELGHDVVVASSWAAMQKISSDGNWDVVLISIAAWVTDNAPRDRFANLAVALRAVSVNAKVVMCAEVEEKPSPGWSFYSDCDMLRDLFPSISREERLRSDSRRVAFVYGGEGADKPPKAHQFYKKNWIALMACSGLFSTDDFNFPDEYVEQYGEKLKP